jgi:hypothetical protein
MHGIAGRHELQYFISRATINQSIICFWQAGGITNTAFELRSGIGIGIRMARHGVFGVSGQRNDFSIWLSTLGRQTSSSSRMERIF